MRPGKRGNRGEAQRLGPRLDQIVDLNHPLAKLGPRIDWTFIEQHLDAVYRDGPGQPPLPTESMQSYGVHYDTNATASSLFAGRKPG
jgi:IS5 family transposase